MPKKTKHPRAHYLSKSQVAWMRLLCANGMSHAEAAEKFGCTRKNVYYHVKHGKLPPLFNPLACALHEAFAGVVANDWPLVAERLRHAAAEAEKKANTQAA